MKKYGLSEEEVQALELPAPPRAAALGAQRYMGNANNAVAGDVETMVAVKGDVMTTSAEELNKAQKIAMLKALRSRVEDLRVQLKEVGTTNAKAKTPAKTPAKAKTSAKAKTPAKEGATPKSKDPTPIARKTRGAVKRANETPAKPAKKAKK